MNLPLMQIKGCYVELPQKWQKSNRSKLWLPDFRQEPNRSKMQLPDFRQGQNRHIRSENRGCYSGLMP